MAGSVKTHIGRVRAAPLVYLLPCPVSLPTPTRHPPSKPLSSTGILFSDSVVCRGPSVPPPLVTFRGRTLFPKKNSCHPLFNSLFSSTHHFSPTFR